MAMNATGYAFDSYVVDALMRDLVGHDRRPSAYLVYLALTAVAGEGRALMTLTQISERTGLSKRSVQEALRHLEGRGLLITRKEAPTDPCRYEPLRPWRRP